MPEPLLFLTWPTPPALFLAARIYKEKGSTDMEVQEAGQRTIHQFLAAAAAAPPGQVVVIFPFVDRKTVAAPIQRITRRGGQVCWYGETGQPEKNTLTAPGLPGLYCDDVRLDHSSKAMTSQVNDYLRYKVARAFLGDPQGNVDRRHFKEAVIWLAKNPETIPPHEKTRVETFARFDYPALAGSAPPVKKVKQTLHLVAKTDINVLLTGDTGTGKEAVAFFLHCLDPERCDKSYGAINCAALNEEFLISELFGHEKGAFTGAVSKRKGLVPRLDGGTLFLDELPDMSSRIQGMLLRFLESGVYTPLGSDTENRADVKIVAGAQGERLREKIENNGFRKDLYYRLAEKTIQLPGLKDVPQDIPIIVDHLVYSLEPDRQKRNDTIVCFAGGMEALQNYSWPGNVRELRSFVKRRIKLGKDEPLEPGGSDLHVPPCPPRANLPQSVSGRFPLDFPEIYPDTAIPAAQTIYTGYIRHVFAQLRNHRLTDRDIAKKLGISVNTLKKHRNP